MKFTHNTLIVLLVITAAILGGMLVSVWQDRTAQAAYSSVSKGDYVIGAMEWSTDLDFVYVIDVAKNRLKLYTPNRNTKALDAIQDVNLEQVFGGD